MTTQEMDVADQGSSASIADRDEDYRRIGISRDGVAGWEDGARTDGSRGTYEWWYFDAHLDNGAKLVVVFMTKDLSAPKKPLTPMIRLNLDLPDGSSRKLIRTFPADSYAAGRDHADVTIAGNRFAGDLTHYTINAEIDDVRVDVTLGSQIRPWRPKTGYLLFGEERRHEFSWLPAVPQGTVTGSYQVAGERTEVTGIGYHDHNWGNIGLPSVINDWYWARGQAGPYSVIAPSITAHRRYGYAQIPIFLLARNGEIVADDASRAQFVAKEISTDPATGKPVAELTQYSYQHGSDRYLVTFRRRRNLVANKFIDEMSGLRKAVARLIRFDGAYLRFVGELTIERWSGTSLVESFHDEAIWELMYFGHARTAEQQAPNRS